jgi:hypothetical protein
MGTATKHTYSSPLIICGSLAGLLMLPAAAVAQITATFGANRDNTLYETTAGNLSNGAGQYMFAGNIADRGGGASRRAVVGFNVSSIPRGSTVTSARLTLHMSKTIATAQNVRLFQLTTNWGEGTSNAPAEEGMGTAATTNSATWLHTFFSANRWTRAGGDFATTASATESVAGIGDYTWGSTAQMVADVQEWVNNPAANFGWILIGNEAANTTSKRFDTSEHPTAAFRPELVIAYRPIPEPASIALAAGGMGALGLLAFRRRRRPGVRVPSAGPRHDV